MRAEAYYSSAYKEALTILEPVIERTPRVGTPDVLHTTLHESHAGVAAA